MSTLSLYVLQVPMPLQSRQLLEILGKKRAGTKACSSGVEQIASDAGMESLKRDKN